MPPSTPVPHRGATLPVRPITSTTLRPLQSSLESTTQALYELLVTTARYEAPTAVIQNIEKYVSSLSGLQSSLPQSDETIFPVDLLHYVDDGRNPDVYTREFVELAMKNNQLVNGKMEAFEDFFESLAREVEGAFPELEGEVRRIRGTCGK